MPIVHVTHETDVVLGRKYTDKITGLEGVADAITFYRNACARVSLVYVREGKVEMHVADEVDLVDVEFEQPAQSKLPGGPARHVPPPR
jgi:hypothetical protein